MKTIIKKVKDLVKGDIIWINPTQKCGFATDEKQSNMLIVHDVKKGLNWESVVTGYNAFTKEAVRLIMSTDHEFKLHNHSDKTWLTDEQAADTPYLWYDDPTMSVKGFHTINLSERKSATRKKQNRYDSSSEAYGAFLFPEFYENTSKDTCYEAFKVSTYLDNTTVGRWALKNLNLANLTYNYVINDNVSHSPVLTPHYLIITAGDGHESISLGAINLKTTAMLIDKKHTSILTYHINKITRVNDNGTLKFRAEITFYRRLEPCHRQLEPYFRKCNGDGVKAWELYRLTLQANDYAAV